VIVIGRVPPHVFHVFSSERGSPGAIRLGRTIFVATRALLTRWPLNVGYSGIAWFLRLVSAPAHPAMSAFNHIGHIIQDNVFAQHSGFSLNFSMSPAQLIDPATKLLF
jgi:hypothetical protein